MPPFVKNMFFFGVLTLCCVLIARRVPKYMLPRGMQVADLNRKRKRRRNKHRSDGSRRTDNDPLQSFDGEGVNLDSVEGGDGDDNDGDGSADEFAEFFDSDDKGQKKGTVASEKVVFSTRDGTGKSTSGRGAWKEKHRKGKFSGKRRKSEPPRRRVGI